MIIADTSGLLAAFDRAEPEHDAVVAVLDRDLSPIVVSPLVLKELDHLILGRYGVAGEIPVIDSVADSGFVLPHLDGDDLRRCVDVIVQHQELPIGLADASLVVSAERYGTRRILTLDRRHFTVLKPLQGGEFELLP